MHPLAVLLAAVPLLAQTPTPPLATARTFALPAVRGRIDHLVYDASTQRLFVAALGNGSLEVIDVQKGERVTGVDGLPEPQGVALVPARGMVAVACGGDGTLRLYDCATLAKKAEIEVGADADNVRLSADGATLLVGEGDGSLAFVDVGKLQLRGKAKLPGHPESFQLDGQRAVVNVPGARPAAVVAVDLEQRRATATFALADAGNYPMAFDSGRGRLLVACRKPARLCVLDAASGKTLSRTECVDDADDVFLDDKNGRVLVIGGGGAVDVFAFGAGDACERIASVPTSKGARTGLWVPGLRRLFVAVPQRGDQGAAIRELRAPE
jgi:hypothetical protein